MRCSVIVCVTTILEPLPDVAVHVIQSEPIRGEGTDWGGVLVVPSAAAGSAVGVVIADLVTPRIGRLRPRARRVFELGLRKQPVGLAGHPRQPCGVMPGIIPRDVYDRLPAVPPPTAVAYARAITVRHASV